MLQLGRSLRKRTGCEPQELQCRLLSSHGGDEDITQQMYAWFTKIAGIVVVVYDIYHLFHSSKSSLIMATTKLFMTGVTGHTGSSILVHLLRTLPYLEITALLRTVKPDFKKRFPTVRIVEGDFDTSEVLERAAAASDIVLHAGWSDHLGSAEACLRGLLAAFSKDGRKRFYIHLSGSGCIADMDSNDWTGHQARRGRAWNDVRDIEELRNDVPDSGLHRLVDKPIFAFGTEHQDKVCTAIVAPGDIYGEIDDSNGSGTLSVMIPTAVELAARRGRVFQLGAGENLRGFVHMEDVVRVFGQLVAKATQGGQGAHWGADGFYFVIHLVVEYRKVAERIAAIVLRDGWLRDGEVDALGEVELRQLAASAPEQTRYLYLFGSNAAVEADRAHRIGWIPQPSSFWAHLEQEVRTARQQGVRT